MRAGKGFTLFILNEDMNDIMKITKLLEHSGVISDGVTETTKLEIENQQGRFLGSHSIILVQSVISLVVNGINVKGIGRAGRGYTNNFF